MEKVYNLIQYDDLFNTTTVKTTDGDNIIYFTGILQIKVDGYVKQINLTSKGIKGWCIHGSDRVIMASMRRLEDRDMFNKYITSANVYIYDDKDSGDTGIPKLIKDKNMSQTIDNIIKYYTNDFTAVQSIKPYKWVNNERYNRVIGNLQEKTSFIPEVFLCRVCFREIVYAVDVLVVVDENHEVRRSKDLRYFGPYDY